MYQFKFFFISILICEFIFNAVSFGSTHRQPCFQMKETRDVVFSTANESVLTTFFFTQRTCDDKIFPTTSSTKKKIFQPTKRWQRFFFQPTPLWRHTFFFNPQSCDDKVLSTKFSFNQQCTEKPTICDEKILPLLAVFFFQPTNQLRQALLPMCWQSFLS